MEPSNALAAIARDRLLAWDGSMDAHLVQPPIYSAMRDALLKEIFDRNLPADLADAAWHPADRGLGSFGNRLKARIVEMLRDDDRSLLAEGDTWAEAISRALTKGVATLFARLGDDPDAWVWDRVHRAVPRHTLSAALPGARRPARPDVHPPQRRRRHAATGRLLASHLRHGQPACRWPATPTTPQTGTTPCGSFPSAAPAIPAAPHYSDQSETWRKVEMVPMRWDWDAIIGNAESRQTLQPA